MLERASRGSFSLLRPPLLCPSSSVFVKWAAPHILLLDVAGSSHIGHHEREVVPGYRIDFGRGTVSPAKTAVTRTATAGTATTGTVTTGTVTTGIVTTGMGLKPNRRRLLPKRRSLPLLLPLVTSLRLPASLSRPCHSLHQHPPCHLPPH